MRAALLIVLGLLLAGCSSYQPPARATPQVPAVAPVDISDTGTWGKSLASTDCADFTSKMTPTEQFIVSRVLLAMARMTTVPSAAPPTDDLVGRFRQGLANQCGQQGSDYLLVLAEAHVYASDKTYEPTYR
jgi:hypothetical protein